MNAFEKHGIGKLSYSSADMFARDQGFWCLKYLHKYREPTSASMARGLAAERGLDIALRTPGADADVACKKAVEDFNKETAFGVPEEDRERERGYIPEMVKQALPVLQPLGVPTSYQQRLEIQLPEVPVPVVMYLDWTYDDQGFFVDLKTTTRCPSDISHSHRKQGALYQHGTGLKARFCYVTPKRCELYDLTDAGDDLEWVRQTFIRMERFLSISADARELLALTIPHYDSFYWNSTQNRDKGREVFGY